jgi:hypothetical protein
MVQLRVGGPGRTSPVVALMAAKLLLGSPPTWVNWPPMKIVESLAARARTPGLDGFGFHAVAAPVAASSAASPARACPPMFENPPPA